MTLYPLARAALLAALVTLVASCGGGGLFGKNRNGGSVLGAVGDAPAPIDNQDRRDRRGTKGGSLRDLFGKGADANTTVEVNKYLWVAAQDVLSFLPVESVDPFTGVLVTGYGTPPGGGRAYRATIYVQDPALDARSLKVALQTRGGGPVSADTQRAVEDAILTRARQLRIRDSKL